MHVSLNGNSSRTFRGLKQSYTDYSAIAESNPIKLNKTFQATYGLSAQTYSNSVLGSTQSSAGLRARVQSFAIPVDSNTNLSTNFSAGLVKGINVGDGFLFSANTTLSRRLGNKGTMLMSYDFTRDGYNDRALGHHRLGLQTYWTLGRIDMNLFGSKSVDVNRLNLFGDMGFRLSPLWRLSASYTYDQYLENKYLDYYVAIGYRLGWREVGLIWSKRTNRFGIQLLGATLD